MSLGASYKKKWQKKEKHDCLLNGFSWSVIKTEAILICINLQALLNAESSGFQILDNNSLIEKLWAEIGFWTIIYSASKAFFKKRKTTYKSPIFSY